MFEKTTIAIGQAVYVALMFGGLGWLAWVFLDNMPWGFAVVFFIPVAVLAVALFGHLVVVIAMLVGVLCAAIVCVATYVKKSF